MDFLNKKKISIEVPKYNSSALCWEYYIITEGYRYNDNVFIKVPHLNNCMTTLSVQVCHSDSLITYLNNYKEIITIPCHAPSLGKEPIFRFPKDCYEEPWQCPQNFFYSKTKAEETLNFIIAKYGSLTRTEFEESKKFSHLISPFGHFGEK